MKRTLLITALSVPFILSSAAFAQTTTAPEDTQSADQMDATPQNPESSSQVLGSDSDKQTKSGWSVSDKIIGQNVYNEEQEKVGDIRDVVLDDNGQATDYVIGVGGFLGMAEHSVAIPYDEVDYAEDQFILRNYTKDQLKDLPEVKVTKDK